MSFITFLVISACLQADVQPYPEVTWCTGTSGSDCGYKSDLDTTNAYCARVSLGCSYWNGSNWTTPCNYGCKTQTLLTCEHEKTVFDGQKAKVFGKWTGKFVCSNGSGGSSGNPIYGGSEPDGWQVGRGYRRYDSEQECPKGANSTLTDHPVKVDRGEKYYSFTDYQEEGDFPIIIQRQYVVSVMPADFTSNNNTPVSNATWNMSYTQNLRSYTFNGSRYAIVTRANGTFDKYKETSGGSTTYTLQEGTGTDVLSAEYVSGSIVEWVLVSKGQAVERFGANGDLKNISDNFGRVHTVNLVRDPSSKAVTQITIIDDQTGSSVVMHFSDEKLSSLDYPGGGSVEYIWDTNGRLSAVIYPDGDGNQGNDFTQVYDYESMYQNGFETLITGIFETDRADYLAGTKEAWKKYSHVEYDTLGRVSLSELYNGSEGVETKAFDYSWANWASNSSTPFTTITNGAGLSTTYHFQVPSGKNIRNSRNWRITSVDGAADLASGCAATSASTTYDSSGFLQTTTDNNAINTAIVRKTQRLRDSHGRIETLSTGLDSNLNTTTDSQKVTTSYWDSTTNLPASKTYYGYKTGENDYRQEVFTYYPGNNRIATRTVKDLSGQGYLDRVWTYHYSPTDSSVNIEQMRVTDPRSYTTTYNYSNGHLTSVSKPSVNGVTQIIQYDIFNSFGLPRTVTEMPNNVVTQLEYDARGRLIDSTTAGAHTHIDYWPNGLVKKVTSPDLSWLFYDYNSAHQLTRISNQAGEHIEYNADPTNYPLNPINGKWQQAVTYDGSGNVKLQQHRLFDALGRLWKQKDADGTDKTIFSYDANDNLQTIVALGDGSSSTPATYDGVNRVTFREFDGQNRIKCSMDTSPVAPYTCMGSVESTKYTYDDQGNVATVTDANGHITQYIYNGFGELVREESPDRGVTTYEYDLAGNLSKKTKAPDDVDEDGAGPDKDDTLEITYSWDALNRLTSIDYPGTAQDITYVYDEPNHGAGVGRLTHVVDANGTTHYFYNAFGNVIQKEETLTGLPSAQITLYGYNSANELESITYPSGQVVHVTRENSVGGETLGRISALRNNSVDLISSVGHQPFGGITGWNTNSNDLINQYIRNYDANGHLAQYGVGATSQNETAMYTLQYDAYGSISALLDPSDLVKEAYGYDAQNRLTSVSAEYGDISYGYDAVGNRTGKVFNRFDPASNAIQEFYTEAYGIDPNSNRINSIIRKVGGSTVRTRSFDYDARGNIKTDTRQKTGEAAKSYPLIYGDSDRLNSITAP